MNELSRTVFSPFESRIFNCYPGGNDTFIFCNRRVHRESYSHIEQLVRHRYPRFEQGVAIERAKRGRAVLRAETMSGGLSPNSVRSVAALVADSFCRHPSAISFAQMDLVKVCREHMIFPLEVSGYKQPIEATTWASGDNWQVEIELPQISSVRIDRGIHLEIDDVTCCCDVVRLPGTVQVLIPEKALPFQRSRAAIFRRVIAVRKQLKLESCRVFELVWWSEEEDSLRIHPVSYVRRSDTCMDQTGSGASAVAVALALDDGRSRGVRRIQQPSGVELRVRIQPAPRPECAPQVFLTGPVTLRGELNALEQEQPDYGKLYIVR